MAFLTQRVAVRSAAALGAGSAVAILSTRNPVAQCDDKDPPHPPRYPFWIKSMFHSQEIPSVRRGYEVYRQVFATCHSM